MQLKRQLDRIDEPRRLTPRHNRTLIEQGSLIAPAVPSRLSFAREQFKVRPADEPLNALAHAIRLPAVFAPLLYYETANVFGFARWLAACCEQALFGIGTRPISKAGKIIRVVPGRTVELHPIEGDRLVLEAPSFDQLESARQERIGRPQEQRAIVGGKFRNWQR